MSSDGSPIGTNGEGNQRPRRSSITQAALSNLFGRGSVSNGSQYAQNPNEPQRRRLSVNTLGLSGSLPNNPPSFSMRRGSQSTNSDSIDESAIEDDEATAPGNKTAPTTPFVRRMSLGGAAMRGYRAGGSPGNDQQGFNWSDQLKSRAENSIAAGPRPSFSLGSGSGSPPRVSPQHDRAKSVSDMPQPPAQASGVKPRQERAKPDAFQERILKGDFYMD